jgi:hypothetical protein
MERRLWPASSSAWTTACLARTRLANRSLRHGESGFWTGAGSLASPFAIGDQHAKALAVAGDSPLSSLPEVVPQMPAVGDLRRLGCPRCGAFREERRAVPADDLDPGSLRQPMRQAGRLPVRQQIHRPTGLDLDEHRAVDPSLACGVLINTNHPRGRNFGFGQRSEQPQHRAAADGHPEGPCHPGASPAGEGETHRGESRPQPLRPPAAPPGQSRHLLSRTRSRRTTRRPPLGTSAGNRR